MGHPSLGQILGISGHKDTPGLLPMMSVYFEFDEDGATRQDQMPNLLRTQ